MLLFASACSGDDATSADPGHSATSSGAGGGATTSSTSSGSTSNTTTSSGSGGAGTGPSVGGCQLFPGDDAWNTEIVDEPVDAAWTQRIHSLAGDINLHPDFGDYGPGARYGMPVNVVPETQPPLEVQFDSWPTQSDPSPYPFPDPQTAGIEGGEATACEGDCHLLVLQQGVCLLYEGLGCSYQGGWHCACGARWDLATNSYGQRPKDWTSADAAGLAILPGLVRYDEVVAGEVKHALRFTMSCTRSSYVAPATHQAVPPGCQGNENAPPMGLRVRLRPAFDISGFPPVAQTVLTAMKRYGMILADNGSDFYFQGERHPGLTGEDVDPLKSIPVSAFEAITPAPLEP